MLVNVEKACSGVTFFPYNHSITVIFWAGLMYPGRASKRRGRGKTRGRILALVNSKALTQGRLNADKAKKLSEN